MAADRPLRVAFLYMKGRLRRLPEVEQGTAPTEFFYGAIEMGQQGYEIEHYEIDPKDSGSFAERLLGTLWLRSARPVKLEASTLTQAYQLAKVLNRADCLVATGGNIAYALAALARVGIIRRPIIGIQCGILNFVHSPARRWASRALLRRMHTMLFGLSELAPMRQSFDLSEDEISVNYFGVDTQFWQPGTAQRDIVLAVGNDGRRDFATLVAAAECIDAPVHIVTKLPLPSPLPANVTNHRGSWHGTEISDVQIRELYQRALAVAVPLIPSPQPSGQSVALQAMACGCPVVLTETEGLWSRDHMKDGRNVLLVPPGDAAQLAVKLNAAIADTRAGRALGQAARESVERIGNIENFAAEMARCASASVR